jgi:hypothetical protein
MAYRSVTLAPGETYVLPAGAQILAADNPGLITSQNNCANLDNLEELVCIEINWAIQPDDGGGTAPWSVAGGPDSYCIGIGIDDVDYDFLISNPIADDYSLIKTRINAIPALSGVINCYDSSNNGAPTTERIKYSVKIQTLSSIAEKIYLRFQVVDFDATRVYGQLIDCPAPEAP